MAKIDSYVYQEGEVRLAFHFDKGPNIITQKKVFRSLLAKAIADLNEELTGEDAKSAK